MEHPEHFFIVKRLKADGEPWEYLQGDLETLAECRAAVIASFDGGDLPPHADTLLVMEIDGHTALNRTDDLLRQIVVTDSQRQRYIGMQWQTVKTFSVWPAELMPAHMPRAA